MGVEAFECLGDAARCQSCAIDDGIGLELGPLAIGLDLEVYSAGRRLAALESREHCDGAAGGLDIAAQRDHEAVAVDDPRRWRANAGCADDGGLVLPDFSSRQWRNVIDAVRQRLLPQRLQRIDLIIANCNDELAAARMRYALLSAVIVEQTAASHAELRFETRLGVVDPRMDDLRVAG